MRAYFLIIVDNRGFGHRKTVNPTLELEEIPGVKKVEGVSGLYDYLVEIDTSAKITSVAEKIMEKPWLKRLHILRPIESPCPFNIGYSSNNTVQEFKIQKMHHLQKFDIRQTK